MWHIFEGQSVELTLLYYDIHLKVNQPTLGFCFELQNETSLWLSFEGQSADFRFLVGNRACSQNFYSQKLHYDIHLKVNLLTLWFDIKIKLGVESLIHYDIHLKVNRPTLDFCFEVKIEVESLIHKIGRHCEIYFEVNRWSLRFGIEILLGIDFSIQTIAGLMTFRYDCITFERY